MAREKTLDNEKFPKLSNRVNYLKYNQEGVRAMCDVVERYAADEVKEVKEQYDAIIAQMNVAHEAEIAALKAEMEKLKAQMESK